MSKSVKNNGDWQAGKEVVIGRYSVPHTVCSSLMQQHQLVQGTVEQMEDTGLHKQVPSLLLQLLITFRLILYHEIKINGCDR